MMVLSACGGDGSAPPAGEGGNGNGSATGRWSTAAGAATSNPGVSGLLTLNEYDWGCCTTAYLGVIQLELSTGKKERFLDGANPSRHPNGKTSFVQFCGTGVNRVALADATGRIQPITSCSSEIANPGDSPTYYGFSKLSPDERYIAVEVIYDISFNPSHVSTAVYDLQGTLLSELEDLGAPAWTLDGRLILAGEGLFIAQPTSPDPQRLDLGQLNGPVNNPAVHPSGDRVAFEYNQQIWEMGLDGSGLRERVSGPARLRYPTYSPDGRLLAHLATSQADYYERALYFTDLEEGSSYAFDVAGIIGALNQPSIVPNGPLSWTDAP